MLRRQGLKLHPAIGALPRTFVKETYSIQHMFQYVYICFYIYVYTKDETSNCHDEADQLETRNHSV